MLHLGLVQRIRKGRLTLLGVLLALTAVVPVHAQDVFFTQSGGRGLQNAKLNARMSKTEGDVVAVQIEMAKVQPHAKAPITACSKPGDKIRWDGVKWLCESESDPTVQPWAKEALPACGPGQVLSAVGGRFGCAADGGLIEETDPTVQQFAKTPLPTCGTGEMLSVGGDGNLRCALDGTGLTQETDPHVHIFARTDAGPVPNCAPNQLLTMNGGRLQCQYDTVGITEEADPLVAHFARNDVPGYTLAACAADEVVVASAGSGPGGQVILQCQQIGDMLVGVLALDDLSDVETAGQATGKVLMFDGTLWKPQDENDPNLQIWARNNYTLNACGTGQVITYNGTEMVCTNDAGSSADPIMLSDLGDVTIAAPTTGQLLRYTGTGWENSADKVSTLASGKWCSSDGDVITCELDAPLNCAADEVLKWNGTAWTCVNAGTGLGLGTMALQDADDVSITGGIINGTAIGGSNPSTGVFTNITATSATLGNLSVVNIYGTGLFRAPSLQVSQALVQGNARVNGNLTVDGSLFVSGSQSIDGVIFANGGVSATGAITATAFYGDGSGLTNVTANLADRIISGTTNVIAGQNGSVTVTVGGTPQVVFGPAGHVILGNVVPNASYVDNSLYSAGDVYAAVNLRGSNVVVANNGGMLWSDAGTSVRGNSTAGGNPSITFTVNNAEAVRIVSSGSVGFGTGLPSATLHLVNTNPRIYLTDTNTGAISALNADSGVGSLYLEADRFNTAANSLIGLTVDGSRTLTAGGNKVGIGWAIGTPNDISTALHVAGTLRIADGGEACDANRVGAVKYVGNEFSFCRNGTAWESLTDIANAAAGLADRISSGTTTMVVNSATGYVSLTQSGTNTAWFDPTRGLVTLGVSSTGPISGTRGYFSSNVGIGTMAPSATLHVSGTVLIANGGAIGTQISIDGTGNGTVIGVGVPQRIGTSAANSFGILTSGSTRVFIPASGGVAVGGAFTPSTSLHVSGTLRITDGTESCDSNRTGAVKYAGGEFSFCRNGTTWETLTSIANAAAGLADRISSGTTTMVVNSATGYVSLTQSAANTAWFDPARGLVTLGVSSTGPISATSVYAGVGGASGSLVYRDENGVLVASSSIAISSTNGSMAIGGAMPSYIGPRSLYVGGNVYTGTLYGSSVGLSNNATITWSGPGSVIIQGDGSAANQYLRFLTSGTEAMRIVSTGYVGIGTTAPSSTLHLVGVSGGANAGLTLGDTVGNTHLQIFPVGGVSSQISMSTGAVLNVTGGGSSILTLSNANGTRYAIVGMGNSNPSATFQVAGSIKMGAETSTTLQVCDANRMGAIKYESGDFAVCRNGSAWETFTSIAQGAAGLADRISSGTTTMVVNSATGFVSLTQSAANTAWFDPARGLVTLGVSSTGPISGTAGYFSGNVGVGVVAPTASFEVSRASSLGNFGALNLANAIMVIREVGRNLYLDGNGIISDAPLNFGTQNARDIYIGTNNIERMRVAANGQISIGTPTATTALTVSGTLRISDGTEACDTDRTGAVKYAGGEFSFCRNGTAWETLTSVAATTSVSTGVSGSLVFRDNLGALKASSGLVISSTTGHVMLGSFTPNSSYVANSLYAQGDVYANTNLRGSNVVLVNTGGVLWGDGNTSIRGNAASTTNSSITFSVSGSEAVRIVSSGYVGIGGFAPAALLHVSGSTQGSTTLMVGNPSSTNLQMTHHLIQARNNGAVTSLFLNTNGGYVGIGSGSGVGIGWGGVGGSSTLHVKGQIQMISDTGSQATCDANRIGAMRYAAGDFSFCRNGSAWETLTDVATGAAGLADRISSGTTTMVVNSATGYVSLTQSGTNTAWFDPTRGLVTLGISSTGKISATAGYFGGQVDVVNSTVGGIVSFGNGTNAGSLQYTTGGSFRMTNFGSGGILAFNVNNSTEAMRIINSGYVGIGGITTPSSTLHIMGVSNSAGGLTMSGSDGTKRLEMYPAGSSSVMNILSSGGFSSWYGISVAPSNHRITFAVSGTLVGPSNAPASPSTTLHVAGSVRLASESVSTMQACDAGRTGAIKYDGGEFSFCRNGTAWETLTSVASGVSVTTGVSGSLVYRDQNGALVASNSLVISATTGSVGIGTAPANIGNNGLYVAGMILAVQNIAGNNFVANNNSGLLWGSGSTAIRATSSGDNSITFIVSNSEAMRIVSTGYVGIGTAAPSSTLHVYNSDAKLQLSSPGGVSVVVAASDVGPQAFIGTGSNHSLNLRTNGTTRLTLDTGTGNARFTQSVFIGGNNGTSAAGALVSTALSVSGSIKFSAETSSTLATCDANRTGAVKFESGEFSFCRNGTAWETLTSIATGAAAAADRISSGTTTMVVNSATGYVSLTQSGTNTAWFDPTRGLVTLGVSATGPISGTAGYFSGNMGIGTTAPSVTLHVLTDGTQARFARNGGQYVEFVGDSSQNSIYSYSAVAAGKGLVFNATTDVSNTPYVAGSEPFIQFRVMGNNGLVMDQHRRIYMGNGGGVGMASTTLYVNGSVRVGVESSTTLQVCDTNRRGTVKYELGEFSFCRNGTAWETLTSIANGGAIDRIVSGTTSVIVNSATNTISFSTANTTMGWLNAAGELNVRGTLELVTGTGVVRVGQYAGGANTGTYLTATGYQTAYANTGTNVAAYGYAAAYSNSGTQVTALGNSAGYANLGGQATLVGMNAGYSNQSTGLTAVGQNAGQYNSGTVVTLIGLNAGQYNSATFVTAMGQNAAQYNTGGGLFFGVSAGRYNSASDVVAIGNSAAIYNGVAGSYLVAIGNSAAQYNSGSDVIAIGTGAAQNNVGNGVTAVGRSSGANGGAGAPYFTGVGYLSGRYNQGANVTAIGTEAARNNLGNNVTALGYQAVSAVSNTFTNVTGLGYNAQPTKNNQVMLGDTNIAEVFSYGAGVFNQYVRMGSSTTGSLPAAATAGAGAIMYDTSRNDIVFSNGSTWQTVGSVANPATVTSGVSGSLVYRDATGVLLASDSLVISATNGHMVLGTGFTPTTLTYSANSFYAKGDVYAHSNIRGSNAVVVNNGGLLWTDAMTSIRGNAASTTNSSITFTVSNSEAMRIVSSGYVGIGTGNTAPSNTLQVSGTASFGNPAGNNVAILNSLVQGRSGVNISTLFLNTNGGAVLIGNSSSVVGIAHGGAAVSSTLHVRGQIQMASDTGSTATCDVNRVGAMRYNGGDFSFCRNGSAWENLTDIASGAAAAADRITSGTTQLVVVSTTGYVSLTQAGTNTGWFDPTRGLVTLGVSATGTVSGDIVYGNTLTGKYLRVSDTAAAIVSADIQSSGGGISRVRFGHATGYQFAVGRDQNNAFIEYSNAFNIRSGAIGVSSTPVVMAFTATQLVGISTTTPRARLDVNGIVRIATDPSTTLNTCDANRTGAMKYESGEFSFCRDGVNWETLTSIATGAANLADRISSGTTTMVVNSATGYVSLTQSGTNTAWFDPTRGLVALGVSTTGPISGTNGFFSGYMLLGLNANNAPALAVSQTANGIGGITLNNQSNGTSSGIGIQFYQSGSFAGTLQYLHSAYGGVGMYANSSLVMRGAGTNGIVLGATNASGTIRLYSGGDTATPRMVVGNTGGIGIATIDPSTALHVSGTLRIADGAEACDASRRGAVKYAGGEFSFCRNGTAWETLSSIAGAVQGDRIVSGTSSVIVNSATGVVSVTANVAVSGSLKISGQSSECAVAADVGRMMFVNSRGKLQLCVNR